MPISPAKFQQSIRLTTLITVVLATLAVQLDGAEEASVEELLERGASHWAFQPIAKTNVELPDATAEIDRLVADRREQAGVTPLGKADRRTLVRRLYFQLLGLPPTPEEILAVVDDDSPLALENLVDDLLARPEFGERWGRHWLDVARYADSNGCSIEANNTYDNAWRYRDYVIAALNDDKPFDQFVLEQIAGDLLPASTDYRRAEQLIATGFLVLGPKAFGTGSFEQLRLDAVDDQIDTVGKAFLGLSLGCARCHDHKLEPVTTEEYYSLAGIFGSATTVIHQAGWRSGRTWNRVPLPGLDEAAEESLRQRHREQLEEAKSGDLEKNSKAALTALKAELAELEKQEKRNVKKIAKLQRRIARVELKIRNAKQLAKVLPVVSPVPAAMAVAEKEKPIEETVRYGGEPDAKGEVVPRELPLMPYPEGRERYQIPADVSGRLQLAEWLVDLEGGAGRLTARVMVNRVWRHLLGEGIVPTVDNFGLTGQAPTHPELLDFLAATFVEDGWSVKRLVRRIVLSDTYQLASGESASALALDPANRWLWRHTPRRLEVEAIRDAVLSISGQLDRTRGGKTLQHLGLVSIRNDMIHLDTPSPYQRRTVYLPIIRDALGISPELDAAAIMLAAFDGAPPNLLCGARDVSIVPSQNLFMMNSEFLAGSARHTARQLLDSSQTTTDSQRIELLFQIALSRSATSTEIAEALQLLRTLANPRDSTDEAKASNDKLEAWAGLCQAVFSSNEFLFLK